MTATIRPYSPSDKNAVLLLFDWNVPDYFSKEERDGLVFYLDREIELYFVVVINTQIVGCGGINFESTKGIISWDIIHPQFQNQNLGTQLIQHRIEVLNNMPLIEKIVVRTSQHTFKFYQKKGFDLLETEKDYWATGFDLYYMEYKSGQSNIRN